MFQLHLDQKLQTVKDLFHMLMCLTPGFSKGSKLHCCCRVELTLWYCCLEDDSFVAFQAKEKRTVFSSSKYLKLCLMPIVAACRRAFPMSSTTKTDPTVLTCALRTCGFPRFGNDADYLNIKGTTKEIFTPLSMHLIVIFRLHSAGQTPTHRSTGRGRL